MISLGIKKTTAVFIFTGVFLIIIDRFLKILAVGGCLNLINIAGDIFSLNFARNYYIAFSLPVSGAWLNILIILIILCLIFYLVSSWQKNRKDIALASGFVVLGAASNLFDRLKYGYVVDYFDLKYFTVFNLADAMIVVGLAVLCFLVLFGDKKINTQ